MSWRSSHALRLLYKYNSCACVRAWTHAKRFALVRRCASHNSKLRWLLLCLLHYIGIFRHKCLNLVRITSLLITLAWTEKVSMIIDARLSYEVTFYQHSWYKVVAVRGVWRWLAWRWVASWTGWRWVAWRWVASRLRNSETGTRLMGKLLKASIDNLKACTRTSSNKLKARLYTTYISYMASQRWRSLKEVHARWLYN